MKNSLALAYNMKRKRKKMAEGGAADSTVNSDPNKLQSVSDSFKGAVHSYAEGGEASAMEEDDKDLNQLPVDMKKETEDSDDDLVMRIMKKRYSEGGKVANQDEKITGDMPNEFDVLHLDDDLESSYDGANSGDELGNDQEDEDRKDIVSRIMKSRAKKDRLPNPR